ncbi:MAG TPA: hypothetical protein VE287_11100 [Actinopolymorphaceae bacterium]|jgi:hypothetical protein|nr:hypothetical protein [Actinopolymorphaceae bacterium]
MRRLRTGWVVVVPITAMLLALGPSNAPASFAATSVPAPAPHLPAVGTPAADRSGSAASRVRNLDLNSSLTRRLVRYGVAGQPVSGER